MIGAASAVRPSPVELFAVRDARLLGHRLHRDVRYTLVRPGVYAHIEAWSALKPWERYLARVHAYALVRPHAVFALESAAALTGLPVFGEPRDIHVFDQRRARSLRFGDVAVHTSQDRREFITHAGFTVTTTADTVADLARVLPPAFGLAVIDAALRAFPRSLSPGHLSDHAARQSNLRRGRLLGWLWDNADARAESPGESVTRAVAVWWGFPPPELQVEFADEGGRDRVDLYWPRERIVGEFDGDSKYSSDAAEARRQVMDEKIRENRLRRHHRGIARWSWAEVMQATPVQDRLLLQGLRPIARANTTFLTTLRTNPRSLDPRR